MDEIPSKVTLKWIIRPSQTGENVNHQVTSSCKHRMSVKRQHVIIVKTRKQCPQTKEFGPTNRISTNPRLSL
ncbi:hypothetical protein MTP99_008460 [Tenebrio molitor]|nr:hypothetical protein MTP99_008460 [Tenebrio molitor]